MSAFYWKPTYEQLQLIAGWEEQCNDFREGNFKKSDWQ